MNPRMMIGRLVVVTEVFRKYKTFPEGRMRSRLTYLAVDLPEPRAGWYVGERNLRTGDIEAGSYEEGAVFHGKGNLKAHAVVFWPTMAPVLVPVGSMRLWKAESDGDEPRPHAPGKSPKECLQARKDYHANPGSWPRDDKGRFIGG